CRDPERYDRSGRAADAGLLDGPARGLADPRRETGLARAGTAWAELAEIGTEVRRYRAQQVAIGPGTAARAGPGGRHWRCFPYSCCRVRRPRHRSHPVFGVGQRSMNPIDCQTKFKNKINSCTEADRFLLFHSEGGQSIISAWGLM